MVSTLTRFTILLELRSAGRPEYSDLGGPAGQLASQLASQPCESRMDINNLDYFGDAFCEHQNKCIVLLRA